MKQHFSLKALTTHLFNHPANGPAKHELDLTNVAAGELLVQMTKSRSLNPMVTLLSGNTVICRLPPEKLRQLADVFHRLADRIDEPLGADVSGITLDFQVG